MSEIYIVSSCLIGHKCRYDGTDNKNDNVVNFLKDKTYISVCPEELGGLCTPRDPSEIVVENDEVKVVTKNGVDVTKEFELGAKISLEVAKSNKCSVAILKSKSPSCGNNQIYDGTFSSRLISGSGLTAKLLSDNGIKIINEKDVRK